MYSLITWMDRILLQDFATVKKVRNVDPKDRGWYVDGLPHNGVIFALSPLAFEACKQQVTTATACQQ